MSTVEPQALLFDFDGLLCDTERAAHQSWVELYDSFGFTFPAALWASMVGHTDGEQTAVADLAERLGRPVDRSLVQARRERKAELCGREPLRPGVADLLGGATASRLRLAVVSSSGRDWVEHHLCRLGIRDRFEAVATGGGPERPKPAPDLYQAMLWRLAIPAEGALAFEDSPRGVLAARAAGIRCVAVPNAFGDPADLGAASVVLASLADFVLDWPRLA